MSSTNEGGEDVVKNKIFSSTTSFSHHYHANPETAALACAPPSVTAAAIMFGTIMFATVALAAKAWVSGSELKYPNYNSKLMFLDNDDEENDSNDDEKYNYDRKDENSNSKSNGSSRGFKDDVSDDMDGGDDDFLASIVGKGNMTRNEDIGGDSENNGGRRRLNKNNSNSTNANSSISNSNTNDSSNNSSLKKFHKNIKKTTVSVLDVTSYASWFALLNRLSMVGLIMLLAYVSENAYPPSLHSEIGGYDRDQFLFLIVVFLFLSMRVASSNGGGFGGGGDTVRLKRDGGRINEGRDSTNTSESNSSNNNSSNDPDTTTNTMTTGSSPNNIQNQNQNSTVGNNSNLNSSNLNSSGGDDDSTIYTESSSFFTGSSTYTDYTEDDSSVMTSLTHYVRLTANVIPAEDVLNRSQILEWRGWMTLVFLLHARLGANEIDSIVQAGASAHLYMTGYAHLTHLYETNDYSINRFLRVLFRLNFATLFLCLWQNESYLFYGAVPLHTFAFLQTFGVMYIANHINRGTRYGLRLKITILAVLTFLLWDVDTGLFHLLHFGAGIIGGFDSISLWYRLTNLHHWSVLLGMIMAINRPIFSLFLRRVEAMPLAIHLSGKAVLGSSLLFALYLYFTVVTASVTSERGSVNPSTGPHFVFVPILFYVYFRNLTPFLRKMTLIGMKRLGSISLECYLLHHHLLLSCSADNDSTKTSILTILPGWPKVDLLLVLVLHLLASACLKRLTYDLRDVLLPSGAEAKVCLKSLTFLVAGTMAALALSYFLDGMVKGVGHGRFLIVGVVSMVFGGLLYQTVVDLSWDRHFFDNGAGAVVDGEVGMKDRGGTSIGRGHQRQSRHQHHRDLHNATLLPKLIPPIVGILFLSFVGTAWRGATRSLATGTRSGACARMDSLPFAAEGVSSSSSLDVGGSWFYDRRDIHHHQRTSPLLQPVCARHANDGAWIPAGGCDEATEGLAYRTQGVSAFGTCPSSIHYQRDDVFMGDGTVGEENSDISSKTRSMESLRTGPVTWGWRIHRSPSGCRFRRRNMNEILVLLGRRRIIFVGDSMTRNLYHSFRRQMGEINAGAYDATGPRHVDIHSTIAGSSVGGRSHEDGDSGGDRLMINDIDDAVLVDFRWAALARDQVDALKDLNTLVKVNALSRPDIVIVGGGAWDRLYEYTTDADREALIVTLKTLKAQIEMLKKAEVPIVWVTPTTINNPALGTSEKRDHMTESDMADMREVYETTGIGAASSFVVDGPSFTKGRVGESHDGVHYPHDVYDAGAQILVNALDWLVLPLRPLSSKVPMEGMNNQGSIVQTTTSANIGGFANPFLGLMTLCLCFMGLYLFDGLLGFSHVTCVVVRGVLPSDLYFEAYNDLHKRIGTSNARSMVVPTSSDSVSPSSIMSYLTNKVIGGISVEQYNAPHISGKKIRIDPRINGRGVEVSTMDDEIASLLGKMDNEEEIEMKNMGG